MSKRNIYKILFEVVLIASSIIGHVEWICNYIVCMYNVHTYICMYIFYNNSDPAGHKVQSTIDASAESL